MVNREDVPDVVFLRSVVPVDGIEVMAAQWARQMPSTALANSQGKLCKSFAITSERYGADLCGDDLFLEDWGLVVSQERVGTGRRIGINAGRAGHDAPLRPSCRQARWPPCSKPGRFSHAAAIRLPLVPGLPPIPSGYRRLSPVPTDHGGGLDRMSRVEVAVGACSP